MSPKSKPAKVVQNKAYMMLVVDILRKYSDATHLLNAHSIYNLLADQYGTETEQYVDEDVDDAEEIMSVRTIQRCLDDLRIFPFEEFRVKAVKLHDRTRVDRNTGKISDSSIYEGYYYDKPISDAEYRMLIDGILFSRYITSDQADRLTEKLAPYASRHYENYRPIVRKEDSKYFTPKPDFLEHIEILSDAIHRKKTVWMEYGDYDFYGELDVPAYETDTVKLFHPYELVLSQGEYYVLGCYDADSPTDYDAYKVSRILTLSINESSKVNYISSYSVGEYLAAHPKMQSGSPEIIKLKVHISAAEIIVNTFGNKFICQRNSKFEDAESIVIRLSANSEDMFRFALEHGDVVEVLSPQSLRRRISDMAKQLSRSYNQTNDDHYYESLHRMVTKSVAPTHKLDPSDAKYEQKKRALEYLHKMNEHSLFLYDVDLSQHSEHRNVENVQVLHIGNNNISDYHFIENYKELRSIDWCGSLPEDISWFEKLPHLQSFMLCKSRNPKSPKVVVPSFSIFNELTSLKTLYLTDVEIIDPSDFITISIQLKILAIDSDLANGLGEQAIEEFHKSHPMTRIEIRENGRTRRIIERKKE